MGNLTIMLSMQMTVCMDAIRIPKLAKPIIGGSLGMGILNSPITNGVEDAPL